MEYGYFDQVKKEYVITTPVTPVRWINYVGGLDFGGFMDQMGGLLLCKGDPAENRITKYLSQLPGGDMNGTAFFLRIRTQDGYRLYSPFFQPCRVKADSFACHVGLGYNRYIARIDGWELEGIFFVPRGHKTLVMDIRIRNISAEAADADFIPVVEYTHFDALKQFTNADWVPQTMQSTSLKKGNKTALVQYAFMFRDIRWNYFVSNFATSSFETDRSRFLGDKGYGSWASPEALGTPELSNYEARRGDNIAALMHHMGTMKPGDEKRIICQLGQTDKIGDSLWEHVDPYLSEEKADAAFSELADYWSDYLAVLQAETPSTEMNDMLNVHHPKQCFITRNWSRYLSSYQLGYGARGIGMRDSSQDLLGAVQNDPESALKLLKTLMSMQKPDGSAMHQFNPMTLVANEGDSRESEDRPDYYGDDHLWMILSTAFYLKETGDMNFLKKEISFYSLKNRESGTVWEHIRRALHFSFENSGVHGLPLLGFADWNDTINLPTGSESMFNACLFGWGLKEAVEIAEHTGENGLAAEFGRMFETMKERVNGHGWDGDWYVRYFDETGAPLGSHKNDKGKLFVNGQSWPVLAGYADTERARKALASVNRHLNTAHGIKVSWPGYDGFDHHIGGVTTYPPGTKENGGIFLHTNPWVIIAETMLGNGDRAFEYYNQINPAAKDSDVYECEPYCYAQNILSNEHPQFGLARNSWLSGTASWTYVAATRYILGIRPGYDGLLIDPCIPSGWKEYKVTRSLRGAVYEISVKNPAGVSRGVKSCTVNGRLIESGCVPYAQKGETVRVEVILG